MKAHAFMGALAMVIAGAGCSPDCYPVRTVIIDSGTLTGTVTGPAALGFPAAVRDNGSSRAGGRFFLTFYVDGGAADGMDEYPLVFQASGPDPALGQPVTLPDPAYPVSGSPYDTFRDGTLTLNGTTSNGTITSEDLILTFSLGRPDGSLIDVDVDLPAQLHTLDLEDCPTSGPD